MNEIPLSSEMNAGAEENFPSFGQLEARNHEQMILCSDSGSGLKAIIAIHDTTLGPALGGVRMWPYRTEEEAVRDVLRLSRGMTYKAAISGLNFGGGKAVIIGDPQKDKSERLFRAFGRFVDGLGGRYLTAKDMGVDLQDIDWIHAETQHVTCIPQALGGSGDPSPVTAWGVYMGMKACARKVYGSDSLKGKRIVIQGAGHVGSTLADHLSKEEARLFISDIYREKAEELAVRTGGKPVESGSVYELDADIFSPCAMGAVVNDETIDRFKCAIIAGGANNVLENEERHGKSLMERGIVYAPDYVVNAGGIINISGELEGYDAERARQKTSRIYDTVLAILDYAEKNAIPTTEASGILAEERIRKIGRLGIFCA